MRTGTPVKKPAAAARSVSRSAAQPQSGNKDINSSALLQRALDLVHEGQLTAGVAIKMFGIPKSTFYKKLSMCKQQPEPMSIPEQYYQTDGDFQTNFGTDDFGSCSGDIADSIVEATDSTNPSISVGQWSSYNDYYAA